MKTFTFLFLFAFIFLSALPLFPQSATSTGPGYSYEFMNNVNGGVSFNLGDQVATGVRTVELWFKPSAPITSSLSSPQALICRDFSNGSGLSTHEFQLYFSPSSWNDSGTLSWAKRGNSTFYFINSDQNHWEADVWYHVAVTMHPTLGARMYVNGVLQSDTDTTTTSIQLQTGSSFDEVTIGTWGNTSPQIRAFSGEMEEFRLWTIARSQAELRDHMCQKLSGNEAGLRAYYRFDANSGNVLKDMSTNAFDGTLQNASSQTWRLSTAPVGDISI